jgi:hypothetical protein
MSSGTGWIAYVMQTIKDCYKIQTSCPIALGCAYLKSSVRHEGNLRLHLADDAMHPEVDVCNSVIEYP